MTEPVRIGAADVIVLRSPVQITRETAQEIGCQFPRWRVWCTSTGTWVAYRDDEEPHFGRSAIEGRAFMVSAYSSARLIELIDEQTLIDLCVEFPEWQLRRTSAGWAAFTRQRSEPMDAALARIVQCSTISLLQDALRAHPQGATDG
jgi:hypothetical protein